MTKKIPATLDAAFEEVCGELLETFIKKHKDYGKGNILANGELGIAVRVSEKIERIKHLILTEKNPVNEGVDETWEDIAVYAVIAQLYRRGWFEKLELGSGK